jgi:hypothetical protein
MKIYGLEQSDIDIQMFALTDRRNPYQLKNEHCRTLNERYQ